MEINNFWSLQAIKIPAMIKTDIQPRAFLGSGGIFHSILMFMMKLGWQSRYRLPMLLLIAVVGLNCRMGFQFQFIDNPDQNLDQ